MKPQAICIINSGPDVLCTPLCMMVDTSRYCRSWVWYSCVSESRDGESVSMLNSAMAASPIIPTKAIQLNQQEGWRLTQRVDASLAMPIINKRLHRTVFGGELCK